VDKEQQSKLGKRSRRKGKDGERELARILTDAFRCLNLLFQRSLVQERGGGREAPDIEVLGEKGNRLDQVHIEVERAKRCSYRKKMKQAIRDCGSSIPIVIDRDDSADWYVHMRLTDVLAVVDALKVQVVLDITQNSE